MKRARWNPPLRLSAIAVAAFFGLAVAVWSSLAAAQDERDFVFTDAEGHLVLRFAGAGAGPGGLHANQWDEIFNVSVSTMVHDRLKVDAVFEAEPVDGEWAHSMGPRIERHVRETGVIRLGVSSLIGIRLCGARTLNLVGEHGYGEAA